MQIIYEGTDITDSVDVISATHRDASGGLLDSLEIEMENAAAWYRWGPEKDHRIEIISGQFATGIMYLDMMLPEEGKFRVVAASAPSTARRNAWATYEGMTLLQIMNLCAAETGMEAAIYGVDGNTVYPFLIRKNEKPLGFLRRLLALEGAVLKCADGRMIAIGIEYAQALPAGQTIEITADTPKVTHRKADGMKWAGASIDTPYARGSAVDSAAATTLWEAISDEPSPEDVTAARWARGRLLTHNRMAETLSIEQAFNPGMTAMARIDIEGMDAVAGEWVVDEAEHELVGRVTRGKMVRCVGTVR